MRIHPPGSLPDRRECLIWPSTEARAAAPPGPCARKRTFLSAPGVSRFAQPHFPLIAPTYHRLGLNIVAFMVIRDSAISRRSAQPVMGGA
jgi:hypothetical protein